jgi:hypothetical protein
MVDTDMVDRSFQEVCKGMMPADWDACSLGELGERLRAAARHPVVDLEALHVISVGVDGAAMEVDLPAAQSAGDPDFPAVGSAFAQPDWLPHVLWHEGSLIREGTLRNAGDFQSITRRRERAMTLPALAQPLMASSARWKEPPGRRR